MVVLRRRGMRVRPVLHWGMGVNVLPEAVLGNIARAVEDFQFLAKYEMSQYNHPARIRRGHLGRAAHVCERLLMAVALQAACLDPFHQTLDWGLTPRRKALPCTFRVQSARK